HAPSPRLYAAVQQDWPNCNTIQKSAKEGFTSRKNHTLPHDPPTRHGQPAEALPEGSAIARGMGHRTILAVPLLREGTPLGAIVLRRDRPQFRASTIASMLSPTRVGDTRNQQRGPSSS